jgi:monomeric isocitrate dehydrogenase
MDWNTFIEILQSMNISQIIVNGAVVWFFYNRLDKRFENLRVDVKSDIKELREDVQDLRKDVQEIDKRLCRLEGAFASKECCMIKDERFMKKAQ